MHQIKTTENYLGRLSSNQINKSKTIQSVLILLTLVGAFNYTCKTLVILVLIINLVMAAIQLIGPNFLPDTILAYKQSQLSSDYRKYFNELKNLFRDLHDGDLDIKRAKKKYCLLNKQYDCLEDRLKVAVPKKIKGNNKLWIECENDAITEIKTIFK